jgi:peptidoglycan/LPS O-acetylase OafA/YrhL
VNGNPGKRRVSSSRRSETLDGLRGIAVLAVVIQHAWPAVLPGGFAGVDIFFVLSGYLITGLLTTEVGRTGHVDLVAFYARRVRRIIPAALLTILATCLLYAFLLGPALPETTIHESLAATFSASNILFASRATDYFAANPSSSPFLHFWSLGVEEQFYLVWPTLLVAVAVVGRRLGHPLVDRVLVTAVIAGIAISSFALTLASNQANAFFLLPQRAWELMVGGLLAWERGRGFLRLPPQLTAFRVAGVVTAALALAVVLIAAPYLGQWPGPATLLAVLGAALLVAAGDGMPGARVLKTRSLRFFGRISYALYLWHWPLLAATALVALPAADPPFLLTAAAVVIAIALAGASTVLIEEPIRSSSAPAIARGRAITYALVGAVVVAISTLTLTPAIALATAGNPPLAAALRTVRADRERLGADDCYPPLGDSRVRDCIYGAAANSDGSPTIGDSRGLPVVVLMGDSHAEMWFPLVDEWARTMRLALVPITKPSCPALDIPPWSDAAACTAWRTSALARIATLHPILTIVTSSTGVNLNMQGVLVRPRVTGFGPWIAPAARMLESLRDRSARVFFIGDVPRPGFSVPDCLAAHRWSPTDCSRSLTDAMPPEIVRGEQQAAAEAMVSFFDPSPWLCPQQTCTWMTGTSIGWADDHHLTASAALWMAPTLLPLLNQMAGQIACGDGDRRQVNSSGAVAAAAPVSVLGQAFVDG